MNETVTTLTFFPCLLTYPIPYTWSISPSSYIHFSNRLDAVALQCVVNDVYSDILSYAGVNAGVPHGSIFANKHHS